jgi:hypothetical protein
VIGYLAGLWASNSSSAQLIVGANPASAARLCGSEVSVFCEGVDALAGITAGLCSHRRCRLHAFGRRRRPDLVRTLGTNRAAEADAAAGARMSMAAVPTAGCAARENCPINEKILCRPPLPRNVVLACCAAAHRRNVAGGTDEEGLLRSGLIRRKRITAIRPAAAGPRALASVWSASDGNCVDKGRHAT